MSNFKVGTTWLCVDEDNDMCGKTCIIKEIDVNPDHNGDGGIELLYSDGYIHYGKVRRFMPNYTHVCIGE